MLCKDCQYVFKTKFCLNAHGTVWNRKVKSLLSGRESCQLCKILFEWLPKDGPDDTLSYAHSRLFPSRATMNYFLTMRKQANFDTWYVFRISLSIASDVKLSPGMPRFIEFGMIPATDVQPVTSAALLGQGTGDDPALHQGQAWLKNCLENHSYCKKYSQIVASSSLSGQLFRPTRLIEVLPSKIRLHETRNQSYHYIALSHRWPEDLEETPLLRLTVANREQLLERIPESTDVTGRRFSQVFADAVKVCRVLGITYLWIDSLCIIQEGDKKKDWNNESKSMGDVYRHAVCTIAGESISGSDGDICKGIFRTRDRAALAPFVNNATFKGFLPLPLQSGATFQNLVNRINKEHPTPGNYYLMPTNEYHAEISKAKLSTRGWCEQERVLSPRILHFTSQQIYWDCYESMANEVWPKGHPTWNRIWDVRPWTILQDLALHHGSLLSEGDITPHIKYAVDDPMTSWYRMAYNYARTELTKPKDRLVAIAGLASAMQPYLKAKPSDYLAGVWQQSLPYGLLWSARWINRKAGTRVRSDPSDLEKYQGPSWSWASVNWGITMEAWNTDLSPHEAIASVESYKIDLLSNDVPYGQVKPSSQLTLKGRVFKFSLSWTASETNYKGSKYWPVLRFGLVTFVNKFGNVICPDEMYIKGYSKDRKDLVLVAVMRTTTENKRPWIKGLMLEPTGDDGVYRRFGYVHLTSADVKWFNLTTNIPWGSKDEKLITIV